MKIIIKNLQKKIPVNPKRIKKAILKVLSCEGIKKSGEITVCFVNDSEIRKLNKRYTGKDKPTDVLSFDISGKNASEKILADIVISAETAFRNAKYFRTSPVFELCLYVIHGVLHLLGYDDHTLKQKKLMRKKEYVYTQS